MRFLIENFLSETLIFVEEKTKIWGFSKKKRALFQKICTNITERLQYYEMY
jgi:hypothetical protein